MARKGMVDALHEAHRVLAASGTLVDARPDSRVQALVRRDSDRRVVGSVHTRSDTKTDDGLSDRAVRLVVRRGLFRPLRRGRFWHALPFADVRALGAYLADHGRFSSRVSWRVGPSARGAPLLLDRPIRFEVLARR